MTKWIVDVEKSLVNFKVAHLFMAKVHGRITEFNGSLSLENQHLETGEFYFEAAMHTISTGMKERDKQLTSPAFFNVDAYPKMFFQSDKIHRIKENSWEISGDLTIRDQTRKLTFVGTSQWTEDQGQEPNQLFLHIKGIIKRSEFNLMWKSPFKSLNLLVKDEIQLDLKLWYSRL